MTAKDLTGVRLGALVGIRITSTDRYGHRWLLRCDCGREIGRHAAKIRQTFGVHGERTACPECMREERAGAYAHSRKQHFLEMWNEYGNLYGIGDNAREYESVRADVEAECGAIYDPSPLPAEVQPARDSPIAAHQRAAYLYPIADERADSLWRCEHCGTDNERGLGCVLCLAFICAACVRAERHQCRDVYDPTLAEIGRALDVYRGTASRVEQHAFRMFRENAKRLSLADARRLHEKGWVNF